MTRNWKNWTIPLGYRRAAAYKKRPISRSLFKENIPLSAYYLPVLSLHGVNRNDPLPISKKKEEVPVMRAAKMKERPTFQLMCQTDVQSIYHMQMPRWLFSDPRYCEMSLDAKVTYTFLLPKSCASVSSGSRQLLRSWWNSSWYGKNAAGGVTLTRSTWPVSHQSKIRTIPVHRLSQRINRKCAVQEPPI